MKWQQECLHESQAMETKDHQLIYEITSHPRISYLYHIHHTLSLHYHMYIHPNKTLVFNMLHTDTHADDKQK